QVIAEPPERNAEVGGIHGMLDIQDHLDAFEFVQFTKRRLQLADMPRSVLMYGKKETGDALLYQRKIDAGDLGPLRLQPGCRQRRIRRSRKEVLRVGLFFRLRRTVDAHFSAETQLAAAMIQHVHGAL